MTKPSELPAHQRLLLPAHSMLRKPMPHSARGQHGVTEGGVFLSWVRCGPREGMGWGSEVGVLG